MLGFQLNLGSLDFSLGFTAGGNYGKGHGNGDSVTHRHSHIGDKGSQTVLQSGGDTTLKGAQVIGKGVEVNAQNLHIQSVQDSETYQSKQQNASAQVTVGYGFSASGNYSQSKINAEHQSVSEQSGIYAGDDGYQVNVKQHTQLDGGIITSSQSAEDKGKNQFSTATLAHSDIQNHSHYEGESFGIGTDGNVKGGWMGNAKDGLSAASIGYGKDSDSQSSVTRSGINTQNISITDENKQIQLTGKTVEETKADIYTNTTSETAQQHSGSLKNVFDKEKVQSELDLQKTVSQTFSQTSQQVNSEINQKIDAINAALENKNLSAAEKADLEKQRDNWQRGNVIINMISAGLSAPTQSTAGIVAATASPALSYEIGQHFKGLAKENQLTGKTEQEELTAGQKTAHILAHAVLGAAVAAAGDNNALAGAISAGGAEAAAPIISNYLYNEKDGSKLTAEQKETVSAITSLLGTATGTAIGDTTANAVQGSLNAQSAVENNNSARRRPARNPLWTEAQARQNELNAARINALINQIRRIEPNFKGIASLRDPNRPISNEEVQAYEQYLNRIAPKYPISDLPQPSFSTNLLPRTNTPNINTVLNTLTRDISLNQLGQAFNARPRKNGNLDARNIDLQVGFKTVRPNPAASQKGMPVYSNVSEKEIFSVYQQYTGSQPSFRNIPGKGILASTTIQSGSWRGTTVILRNFSTTQSQTKARWTIEFQNSPLGRKTIELKFR